MTELSAVSNLVQEGADRAVRGRMREAVVS
jgi:hypothetical protein